MLRLTVCFTVAVAALVVVPAAFADGPIYVTQSGGGVTSQNGSYHYVAIANGKGATQLLKIYTAGTEVYGDMTIPGSWGTALIGNGGQGLSRDGRTLVLESMTTPLSSPSKFLVVDPTHWKVLRRITLPGSFTFDALSPDASKMYLIQYTSTNDLTDYTVREYDLRANRLVPGKIAARDEDGDESTMAGYAITRTTSASGRWVYTLYQKPTSGMPFIHALDTVRGVAHCIDLPANRGLYNIVLSLQNDDRTLAVHWRSGRPWMNVAVGSWEVSRPSAGGGFPWAWVGPGIGAALALFAAGALLLWRRRRQKFDQHAGQELGLA
jgi:hypothetical protein